MITIRIAKRIRIWGYGIAAPIYIRIPMLSITSPPEATSLLETTHGPALRRVPADRSEDHRTSGVRDDSGVGGWIAGMTLVVAVLLRAAA